MRRIVPALLLLSMLAPAFACDDEDGDGLDVALVLSGGGALATTHVGALTVIEELGVPIHCVVGTSMGSVVGGLFAAGYDAAALRAIFLDSRWAELFAGQIPRSDQPYLRKEQDDLYLSGYIASISADGIKLPAGFRNMSGLQRHYRSLLIRFPLDQDFDALPRPFRAVATDLASGAPVALASGDLVEAMLASMAVPGVFPPRTIDGRTLVDGGLASQLPVATAKAMGADLIIALDTTVEPPKPDASWSVGQVTQQLIRLTVWNNWQAERSRMGESDVLIQPDISTLTTSSFERAAQGFASGEAAASDYREALLNIRRLAAPARVRPLPEVAPHPAVLVVENDSVIRDDLIEKRFAYTDRDLDDAERVRRKLRNLAAFGPFAEADLAVANADVARLQTRSLPLGRNLLNAGVRASSNFIGDSAYSIRGRYSRRPLGPSGSELRVSGQIGSDIGLVVEHYRPFGPESRFFVQPAAGYRGEEFLFDFEETRIGEFWQETAEAQIRFGRELGDWGILAFDGVVSHVRTETKIALVELPEDLTDKYAGGGVLFGVDTLSQAEWPLRGLQLKASAHWLEDLDTEGSSTRYRVKGVKPLDLGWFDVLLRADVHSVDNSQGNVNDILRLGGFRRLTAFTENALIADEYLLGSVEVYRRLTPSETLVSIPIYLGALFEYADVELDVLGPEFADQYFSMAGYLGADTALGPLFVGAGFTTDGQSSVFMHFGRSF